MSLTRQCMRADLDVGEATHAASGSAQPDCLPPPRHQAPPRLSYSGEG